MNIQINSIALDVEENIILIAHLFKNVTGCGIQTAFDFIRRIQLDDFQGMVVDADYFNLTCLTCTIFAGGSFTFGDIFDYQICEDDLTDYDKECIAKTDEVVKTITKFIMDKSYTDVLPAKFMLGLRKSLNGDDWVY